MSTIIVVISLLKSPTDRKLTASTIAVHIRFRYDAPIGTVIK
jgi:hypothetical protein